VQLSRRSAAAVLEHETATRSFNAKPKPNPKPNLNARVRKQSSVNFNFRALSVVTWLLRLALATGATGYAKGEWVASIWGGKVRGEAENIPYGTSTWHTAHHRPPGKVTCCLHWLFCASAFAFAGAELERWHRSLPGLQLKNQGWQKVYGYIFLSSYLELGSSDNLLCR